MKEINMVGKALHTKFDAHTLLKNTILNEINSLNADSLTSNDRGLLTYINRLDWEKSRDFKNRKWVNIIHGHLKNHFDKCAVILDILMPIFINYGFNNMLKMILIIGIFIVAVIPSLLFGISTWFSFYSNY